MSGRNYYKDHDRLKPYETIKSWFIRQHGKVQRFELKPEALLRRLIQSFSSEGHVVLDFCMRYGGTGVAALQEKRCFIGCDLDKEAAKIAYKRLSERFPFSLCNMSTSLQKRSLPSTSESDTYDIRQTTAPMSDFTATDSESETSEDGFLSNQYLALQTKTEKNHQKMKHFSEGSMARIAWLLRLYNGNTSYVEVHIQLKSMGYGAGPTGDYDFKKSIENANGSLNSILKMLS